MHTSVICNTLRNTFKRFQAAIHPDKFASHLQAAHCNAETFKTTGAIVSSFCDLLESRPNQPVFLPLAVTRTEFYLPSYTAPDTELIRLEHGIIFTPQLASACDLLYISWQESALCLFHLLTKASIEYDTRVSQWLIAQSQTPSFNCRDAHGKIFDNLLTLESKSQAFSMNTALEGLRELANVKIVIGELSVKERTIAVESVWRSRDVFRKLLSTAPSLRFLVSSKMSSANLSLIFLPVLFSPQDLRRFEASYRNKR